MANLCGTGVVSFHLPNSLAYCQVHSLNAHLCLQICMPLYLQPPQQRDRCLWLWCKPLSWAGVVLDTPQASCPLHKLWVFLVLIFVLLLSDFLTRDRLYYTQGEGLGAHVGPAPPDKIIRFFWEGSFPRPSRMALRGANVPLLLVSFHINVPHEHRTTKNMPPNITNHGGGSD
jgi:hypothetical protein